MAMAMALALALALALARSAAQIADAFWGRALDDTLMS